MASKVLNDAVSDTTEVDSSHQLSTQLLASFIFIKVISFFIRHLGLSYFLYGIQHYMKAATNNIEENSTQVSDTTKTTSAEKLLKK
jgi:hypothetical protein